MMHRSSFHADYGDTILFPSMILRSKKEAFLASLGLLILGVLYQGLKFLRQHQGRKCLNLDCRRYILNQAHLLQTGLYVVQLIGGYVIMLAIMTYSVWLIVGGVLGLGLGYFFFGWLEGNGVQRVIINPTSKCGLSVTLDCGFQGKEQELQPLSISDGGGNAGDGSIACRCGESSL